MYSLLFTLLYSNPGIKMTPTFFSQDRKPIQVPSLPKIALKNGKWNLLWIIINEEENSNTSYIGKAGALRPINGYLAKK